MCGADKALWNAYTQQEVSGSGVGAAGAWLLGQSAARVIAPRGVSRFRTAASIGAQFSQGGRSQEKQQGQRAAGAMRELLHRHSSTQQVPSDSTATGRENAAIGELIKRGT